MNFFQRFTFLFSAPIFDADDLEGMRVKEIIESIERMGFQVVKARRLEDAELAVQTDAAIGCMVVDWARRSGRQGGVAHQHDAFARPGHADRHSRASQTLRGHSGRGARLH